MSDKWMARWFKLALYFAAATVCHYDRIAKGGDLAFLHYNKCIAELEEEMNSEANRKEEEQHHA